MRMEEDRAKGCENEAVEQVCFADKIFLNKVDLCSREVLDKAIDKIRMHNTQAKIDEVQFNNAEIPFDNILNLDAFSIFRAVEIDEEIFKDQKMKHRKHDKRIGTFSYKMESEMTEQGAN